jgi:hypothetical protein
VQPLHLTLERTDGEDPSGLTAAVREYAARARPVAVRGEKLFIVNSPYRGGAVLKLHVARSEQLGQQIDGIRSAMHTAGLRSLYGETRATSVTALERVEHEGSLESAQWADAVDLFTADELIVSRIVGASKYDILDRVVI